MVMLISYAQNYEDVMLWRALGHVLKGTYIDIGAWDPVTDSVTRLFYEKGWNGINVEPTHHWYQRLQQDRTRDINLNVAISTTPGTMVLYEIEGTGLTTSSRDLCRKHQVESGVSSKEILVPTKTLDEVISENNLRIIHFLKVDVEGSEADVLKSINLTRVRPWIILVEATEPNSQVPTQDQWESMLLDTDYQFAYFDGLNRFYVAIEHPELLNSFNCPPNYFDNFITRAQAECQERFRDAEKQIVRLNIDAESLRSKCAALKSELDSVHKSLSWRCTAPLRHVRRRLIKLFARKPS